MKNNTARSLLLTALFLFFAGTGVARAESCVVPTSCNTDSGWNIELLEGYPELYAPCDDIFPDPNVPGSFIELAECYKWRYKVVNSVGTTSGLTQLLLTIPTICDGQQPLFWGEEASPYLFDPGEGDPTSGFGKDIKSISVARFEPNSTGGYFSFYSPENTVTEATVAIAVKKGDGSCVIGGPSHYCSDEGPNDFSTYSSTEIITTSDNENFRIERYSDTQCIKSAYKLVNSAWVPLDRSPIGDVLQSYGDFGTANLEYVGKEDQLCNEAFAKSEGPNTWYFISGRFVWR